MFVRDPERIELELVSYYAHGVALGVLVRTACEALTRPVLRFNPSDGKQSTSAAKAHRRANAEFWVSVSGDHL